MEININGHFSEDPQKCSEKQDVNGNCGFKLFWKYHSRASLVLEQKKDELKLFKYCVLYLLLVSYFSWATVYFLNHSESDLNSSMCNGYGFLLILFVLFNASLLYYCVIKPYIVPLCSKRAKGYLGICLKRQGKMIFSVSALCLIGAYIVFEARNDFTKLVPILGLVLFILFGFIFSKHPSQIDWKPVIMGLLLQFVFGLLTLKWKVGRNIFECIGGKITSFLAYSRIGAAFVYSDQLVENIGVFVFQALSTIYFLCLIIYVLYHYGIMQQILVTLGEFLQTFMDTTICESVNSAANIFLGMTEAPLLLKPYINMLTASEIHSIMAAGFASVSGTVLAAYISFGASASHLITASIMSAPAALCYSKLIYPETEKTMVTKKSIALTKSEYTSVLDAASQGANFAINIVLGITSNLIAFISIVYFFNGITLWLGELVGCTGDNSWSIERFVGYIFMPISYLLGVPWNECGVVGRLIGIKTIINEFAAFKELGKLKDLSIRTKLIATYSICGFSNFGSVGIVLSTMTVLIPDKREILLEATMRAFITGVVVCLMTACVAALLVSDDNII